MCGLIRYVAIEDKPNKKYRSSGESECWSTWHYRGVGSTQLVRQRNNTYIRYLFYFLNWK